MAMGVAMGIQHAILAVLRTYVLPTIDRGRRDLLTRQ
jgi:hypothetical protein